MENTTQTEDQLEPPKKVTPKRSRSKPKASTKAVSTAPKKKPRLLQITEEVEVAPPPVKQTAKPKIDLSSGSFRLIVMVDPIHEDFVNFFKSLNGPVVNVRQGFYSNYLMNKVRVPAYPFRVTDGFTKNVVWACAGALDPKHPFNPHRVALNQWAATLNNDQEFKLWVDKILGKHCPDFFTTFFHPNNASGTWLLTGLRYQSEIQNLRSRFPKMRVVGVQGMVEPWVNIQIPQDIDPSDLGEALEEMWA